MDSSSIIKSFIFELTEGFILLFLFSVLINSKTFLLNNKYKSLIFIFTYSVFAYWATCYIPLGYHSIVIITFTIISLALITSCKLTHAFLTVLIISIFFIITEFAILLTASTLIHVPISNIMDYPILKLQLSSIIRFIQLMIIFIMYKSEKKFLRFMQSNTNNNMVTYFILGIFLMGMFLFSLNFAIIDTSNILLYEILLFGIFLSFMILGGLVYQEKEQLLKIEHAYKSQQQYIKNIETIMNIIRREKHDFSNHLSTIHAMCTLNKPNTPEKVRMYIDKLSNSLQSSYRYFNTGNDFIDGLLAVKSNFAFNHNIHFEVDFQVPLDHFSVDDENLVSIISNIIDNAFDAIIADKNIENKVVSLCSYTEKNKYYLSIANNGPMIPTEKLEEIFSNGYSSKTTNKEDHGLGLYIVKQLIEKNNGTITVSSDEMETEFIIVFNKEGIDCGEGSSEHHQLNTAK